MPNRFVARLGEYDLMSANDGANPIDMLIEKKIVHESYIQSNVLNDIAMLKLQNNAPLNGRGHFPLFYFFLFIYN